MAALGTYDLHSRSAAAPLHKTAAFQSLTEEESSPFLIFRDALMNDICTLQSALSELRQNVEHALPQPQELDSLGVPFPFVPSEHCATRPDDNGILEVSHVQIACAHEFEGNDVAEHRGATLDGSHMLQGSKALLNAHQTHDYSGDSADSTPMIVFAQEISSSSGSPTQQDGIVFDNRVSQFTNLFGVTKSAALGEKKSAAAVAEHVEVVRQKCLEFRREPSREGKLAQFVRSGIFSGITTLVIFFDSGYTCYLANEQAKNPVGDISQTSKIIEVSLALCYTVEIIMRLIVHRLYFFVNDNMSFNCFEFVLVLQSLFDIFITYIVGVEGSSSSFLRLLRLMKLGKALRILRAAHFLTDLRVMIQAIAGCFCTLFWAFVTLLLFLYIFSLILVQQVTSYRADHWGEYDPKEVISEYFHSVGGALLCLYMACTGGMDWIEVYEALGNIGPSEQAVLPLFIFFFGFAVTAVLSGIFIEKALTSAQPDREVKALEDRRRKMKEIEELVNLINGIDADGSGTLTHEEFLSAFEADDLKDSLFELGLEIADAEMMFALLQDLEGVDALQISQVVQCLGNMKGQASAVDLQILRFETSLIHKKVDHLVHESKNSFESSLGKDT